MAENISGIFEAIQIRSVESFRKALSNSAALIETKDEEGRTPLLFAVLAGYKEIVLEILQHEPNLEARDEEGLSPLMLASSLGRAEIVSHLLQAGALPDGNGSFPKETALMLAPVQNSPKCGELLLHAGADLNGQNKAGSTPLMTAVHWGSLDCARLLINARASMNLRDSKGRTALFHAVESAREDICLALLKTGADPDIRDNDGISPRMLAADSKSAAIRDYFRIG